MRNIGRERLEEIEGQLARTQSDLKVKGQEAEETARSAGTLARELEELRSRPVDKAL